jgi:hypothetical protein
MIESNLSHSSSDLWLKRNLPQSCHPDGGATTNHSGGLPELGETATRCYYSIVAQGYMENGVWRTHWYAPYHEWMLGWCWPRWWADPKQTCGSGERFRSRLVETLVNTLRAGPSCGDGASAPPSVITRRHGLGFRHRGAGVNTMKGRNSPSVLQWLGYRALWQTTEEDHPKGRA